MGHRPLQDKSVLTKGHTIGVSPLRFMPLDTLGLQDVLPDLQVCCTDGPAAQVPLFVLPNKLGHLHALRWQDQYPVQHPPSLLLLLLPLQRFGLHLLGLLQAALPQWCLFQRGLQALLFLCPLLLLL